MLNGAAFRQARAVLLTQKWDPAEAFELADILWTQTDPHADMILSRAMMEYRAEQFREAVEAAKEELRSRINHIPWWRRLFPYRITWERL